MKALELIDLLRLQAKEIKKEGYYGWGNTMELAAEMIEILCDLVDSQDYQ